MMMERAGFPLTAGEGRVRGQTVGLYRIFVRRKAAKERKGTASPTAALLRVGSVLEVPHCCG
jgi:hypothetical protein